MTTVVPASLQSLHVCHCQRAWFWWPAGRGMSSVQLRPTLLPRSTGSCLMGPWYQPASSLASSLPATGPSSSPQPSPRTEGSTPARQSTPWGSALTVSWWRCTVRGEGSGTVSWWRCTVRGEGSGTVSWWRCTVRGEGSGTVSWWRCMVRGEGSGTVSWWRCMVRGRGQAQCPGGGVR